MLRFDSDEAVAVLREALAPDDDDVVEVGTDDADVLAGDSGPVVKVDRVPAQRALDAASNGADILIGADLQPEDSTTVTVAVAAVGRVAFMGDCHYQRYTLGFRDFAGDAFPSERPEAVLENMIVNHRDTVAASQEWHSTSPVPWTDRRPDQRLLDSEEAPLEVLAELDTVTLAFDVPASWRDEDETLCTRIRSPGWGDCTALHLDEPIQLSAYVDRDEPLKIWLLDY